MDENQTTTTGGETFDMSEAVMKEYDNKPWEAGENQPAASSETDHLLNALGLGEEEQAAPTTEETGEEAGEATDPFDFGGDMANEEESGEEGGEESEYVLDFGESFGGTDEVRSMITGHAKELGLPADKAGAFVAAVCDSLRAGMGDARQAGYTELKKEWGRNFDANYEGTRKVLNSMLKAGIIKADQVDAFKDPTVFRAINYMRSRMGEQGTKGMGNNNGGISRKAELKDILENPDNAMGKILMNPMHPKYSETAKYVNGLAGVNLY